MKAAEQKVADLINAFRRNKGRPKLVLDERLSAVCRKYSEERAAGKQSPDGYNHYLDRIAEPNVPHGMASEVVGQVSADKPDPATEVVNVWLDEQRERNAGLFQTTAQEIGRSSHNAIGVGAAKSADGKVFFSVLLFEEDDPSKAGSSASSSPAAADSVLSPSP
ncbi:MAG: CAP domain-containing protein [Verrucomicrobiae bacterium]|nr:CAP domain-containing protein [Verrucomicrobiae bacterium]